jgi:hypothetical protein
MSVNPGALWSLRARTARGPGEPDAALAGEPPREFSLERRPGDA